MQMNTPLFKELSFQLVEGNPWWGMSLINEYLGSDDMLRQVLLRRFLLRIGARAAETPLATRLIEGARSSELPLELRAQIGSREIRRERVVAAPRLRARHERLAVRERTARMSNIRGISARLNSQTTRTSRRLASV